MLKDVESWGITLFEGEKKNTYTMSLKLWSDPTPEDLKWLSGLESLVNACVSHLLKNRREVKTSVSKAGLEAVNTGLSPLKFLSKDDLTTPPTIYLKVLSYEIKGETYWKIRFYDENGEKQLDPSDLISMKMLVTDCVLVIDSIFLSPTVKRLQVHLKEARMIPNPEVSFLAASNLQHPDIVKRLSNSQHAKMASLSNSQQINLEN